MTNKAEYPSEGKRVPSELVKQWLDEWTKYDEATSDIVEDIAQKAAQYSHDQCLRELAGAPQYGENSVVGAAINTLIKIGYTWLGGELWESTTPRLLCVCNDHGCDASKLAVCNAFVAENPTFPDLDCKECQHTRFCHSTDEQALKSEIENLREHLTNCEKALTMKNDEIYDLRKKVAEWALQGAEPVAWRDIATCPRDNNYYLFTTASGKPRVDRFHPAEQTLNASTRWQERPGDRYVVWQPLPAPPTTLKGEG